GEVLALLDEKGGISLSRLAEHLVRQLSPEQKPAIFSSNATGQECMLAFYPELIHLASALRSRPGHPLTYLPFQNDPFFQGRSADFAQLEQFLNDTASAYPARVGITGLGGVGKTQLAVKLAYRLMDQGRYPGGIFWTQMSGSTRASWEEQFASLAVEIGYLPPDDHPAGPENRARRARHMLRYLAEHSDALLILDNLAEPTLLMTQLPLIAGRDVRCAILYTSRVHATPPGVHTHPLAPLPQDMALRLLLAPTRPALLADTGEETGKAELASAQKICQRVGYLPLALVQLSGLLRDRQLSLAHLDEALRQQGMQGLGGQLAAPTTTFSLSWEKVQTE